MSVRRSACWIFSLRTSVTSTRCSTLVRSPPPWKATSTRSSPPISRCRSRSGTGAPGTVRGFSMHRPRRPTARRRAGSTTMAPPRRSPSSTRSTPTAGRSICSIAAWRGSPCARRGCGSRTGERHSVEPRAGHRRPSLKLRLRPPYFPWATRTACWISAVNAAIGSPPFIMGRVAFPLAVSSVSGMDSTGRFSSVANS